MRDKGVWRWLDLCEPVGDWGRRPDLEIHLRAAFETKHVARLIWRGRTASQAFDNAFDLCHLLRGILSHDTGGKPKRIL